MTRGLFFASFLFISFFQISFGADSRFTEALKKSQSLKLHLDRQWLNLLYYRPGFLGGKVSLVASDSFFYAKKGKYDPKQELAATLKAFFGPSIKGVHPLCRFPGRALFFKRRLGNLFSPPKRACQNFKKFAHKMQAKSISLIFSSYYLNRPASAFGHTLIRFNKEGNRELLDYSINFAATVTTKNPLFYALGGLFGSFKGEYAVMPYFYKIREYNDFESRDLWSFELNLTPSEIEMMTAHIWETSQAYFDYYYLSENCSYHMLALIDIARPRLQLQDKMAHIIIPVDTLKLVTKNPKLLKSVSFRPSQRRKLKQRFKALTVDEKKSFFAFVENFDMALLQKKRSAKESINVLDSGIDYLDFIYAKEILGEDSKATQLKRKILLARSHINEKSRELKIRPPQNEAPHKGHGSRRLGLGGGDSKLFQDYYQLEYRLALHDFLDSQQGHNPNAQMEMGNFTLRYFPKKKQHKIKLYEFELIDIISLAPIQPLFKDMSWRVYFGAKSLDDGSCIDKTGRETECFAPMAQVAGGYSQKVSFLHYYFFIGTEFATSKGLGHHGLRLGIGPEIKFLFSPSHQFNFSLLASHKWFALADLKKSYDLGVEVRWQFINNLAFNVKYTRKTRNSEISSAFYHYF